MPEIDPTTTTNNASEELEAAGTASHMRRDVQQNHEREADSQLIARLDQAAISRYILENKR